MFNYRWQVLNGTNATKKINCLMLNILYLEMLAIRNPFSH